MLIDRQSQYSDFIENLWLNLANSTKDILEARQKPHYMYNIISTRLTQFFELELQNLEEKNKPPKC